jgi:hypothetical protein
LEKRLSLEFLPIEADAAADVVSSSAMICGSATEMFSYHRAKLTECLEPNVPYKPMDRCWRNAAPARNRGSTFKGRYVGFFQDLPCEPFEATGKYELPAGDLVLEFLQC